MSAMLPSDCAQAEQVYGFVIGALPASEAAQFVLHLAACTSCRSDVETLRPIMASFVHWPSDVLRPSPSLWERLSARIEGIAGDPAATRPPSRRFEWKEVAPGISCKLLATDLANDRVSMLVRLAPNTEYPPHTHSGVEELHLLHGELWINERKLYPGDYNRAEPGTSDARVWSETGCTCVLITSPSDQLG
ncbi:MAG TPA: cupin domain-containing protein [Gammaproteobacteria bacterium]|nr:cupin domain-containing protein [Gammaproteobacteria bacterium]